MKVVIAPDSFGGTLTAAEAADAMAAGWRRGRPDDEVVVLPMSDGGEGLVDVVAASCAGRWHDAEVAGPLGHPLTGRWYVLDDGTAVVETAEACGTKRLDPDDLDPVQATTYGVGQLLDAARCAGATRLVVGLGGSATVDGGAGALTALGFQLTVDDGSGLKVGGGELHRVRAVHPRWVAEGWGDVAVEVLADVRTVLADAAWVFGPQKGADPATVDLLAHGLATWARVVARDLDADELDDAEGSGAAGGLGYGLSAGLKAPLVAGAPRVASLVGLADALADAGAVVTGEGRLDATSMAGKVVGSVVDDARGAGAAPLAVVGQAAEPVEGLDDLEESSPQGPGDDPAADVAGATQRLAARWSSSTR